MKKAALDAEVIANAEKILNRTLAYQAAVAVHELKELLNLDIEELKLVVAPLDVDTPGCYRVICTIVSLGKPQPVSIELVVQPERAIIPPGKPIPAAEVSKVGGVG
jgi:hypothetical protein